MKMIPPKFDLLKRYRVVIYARMSSDLQNERSIQQQIEQIHGRLRSNGLNWEVVRIYEDSGISGRTERKRPGFQQMMADIRLGRQNVDLIVIDTMERLGRNDQMASTRSMLRDRFGVLIVTADTNFEDPTSASGRTNAMLQEWRSTEENRVKAYQVSRGKSDAVRQGFWPGGPVPFGFKLLLPQSVESGRRRGRGEQTCR